MLKRKNRDLWGAFAIGVPRSPFVIKPIKRDPLLLNNFESFYKIFKTGSATQSQSDYFAGESAK